MRNTLHLEALNRKGQTHLGRPTGLAHRLHFARALVAEQWGWLYKTSQSIWLLAGLLEAMLGLRVFLKLIAANPANAFARFLYEMTALFLRPFVGLVTDPAVDGMVLELHTLIAMIVYALIAWGLVRFVWLIFYRP